MVPPAWPATLLGAGAPCPPFVASVRSDLLGEGATPSNPRLPREDEWYRAGLTRMVALVTTCLNFLVGFGGPGDPQAPVSPLKGSRQPQERVGRPNRTAGPRWTRCGAGLSRDRASGRRGCRVGVGTGDGRERGS